MARIGGWSPARFVTRRARTSTSPTRHRRGGVRPRARARVLLSSRSRLGASRVRRHYDATRRELSRFGGDEVDTAGDGFFALFEGPTSAIRCALAIRDSLLALGLDVRAGVHTGEVERPRGGKPRGI